MAVKSAERVFRIFELLEQSPEGLTNKEVSSLLGLLQAVRLHFCRRWKRMVICQQMNRKDIILEAD